MCKKEELSDSLVYENEEKEANNETRHGLRGISKHVFKHCCGVY